MRLGDGGRELVARSGQQEKQVYWESRLRKILSPLPLYNVLIVSWALESARQGRLKAAAKHIEVLGTAEDYRLLGKFFIPPHNVDSVVNERLTYGPDDAYSRRILDLRTWGAAAKLFNTYNGLANSESVLDFHGSEIMEAMPRLFWPQYDWQIGYDNLPRITKAWMLYATAEAKKAFHSKHGVELDTLTQVAFSIYCATEEFPAIRVPHLLKNGIDANTVVQVLNAIGGTFEQQSRFAQEIRNISLPRDFRRSVVKERPLFLAWDRNSAIIVVPSRDLLLRRITEGLYFDCVQDSASRNAAAAAFEGLCKVMLEHYCSPACKIESERHTSYGMSADLFLHSEAENFEIIAECKSRRLPQAVLTSPNPWMSSPEYFQDIIKGVVQVWRTKQEFSSTSPRKSYGLIITYDPWTALGNTYIREIFREAHKLADKFAVSQEFRIPVISVDYTDLERCLALFSISDLKEAINRSTEEKLHGYFLYGILEEIGAVRKPREERMPYDKLISGRLPWWDNLNSSASEGPSHQR
ncbi:hypothetical protein [Tropicibacter sp. S64]|uniref:hypothetical protein n=1 Tax=Tropicibacter sp. S64 TaxID=3415122 RepID=UPI003C7A697B